MMTQELFSPGMSVTWRDDFSGTMRIVTKDFAPGPFTVIAVDDIPPDKCSCGGSFSDRMHQECAGCPYSDRGYGRVRDSVGHPQWVTIDDGIGERRARRFSGAYFRIV